MTAPEVQEDRTEIVLEDLISRASAAALLRCHPNTLDREADKAGLRRFRVRGDSRVFFLRDEIEAHRNPVHEIAPRGERGYVHGLDPEEADPRRGALDP